MLRTPQGSPPRRTSECFGCTSACAYMLKVQLHASEGRQAGRSGCSRVHQAWGERQACRRSDLAGQLGGDCTLRVLCARSLASAPACAHAQQHSPPLVLPLPRRPRATATFQRLPPRVGCPETCRLHTQSEPVTRPAAAPRSPTHTRRGRHPTPPRWQRRWRRWPRAQCCAAAQIEQTPTDLHTHLTRRTGS